MQESQRLQAYFQELEKKTMEAYKSASSAKKKGYDPEDRVDIPITRNMAERVEGLVSAVTPQIIGSGVSKRIKELEERYGFLDWRVSLTIAEEIAKQKFCKFKDTKEAMITGIRVGFAYHTLGTVASPIEGLTDIKIRKNKLGKPYFALFYSGPIRSAGGTGASVSVLIADYVRKKMGYSEYDPTEEEIERMVTEIYDYHERITNLQYLPSEEEIRFLVKNLPVQLDGEPSEKLEVSRYKDLERIETKNVRNGPCLVLGECLSQKATKVWKQISKWKADFDLEHWNFLEEFLKIQAVVKSKSTEEAKQKEIAPNYTFIKDIVAGRPILTHPLRTGGFRLRYGRSRTSGYSATSIHPATMQVFDRYIATGTQLKLERPGKATVVTSCDTIEGPVVKLKNGDVIKVETAKQAKGLKEEIDEILFVGDLLVNYGDFLNRAHSLVTPGYCEEWWSQELEKATVNLFGALDLDKLSELAEVPKNNLKSFLTKPLISKPNVLEAIQLAEKLRIPLHPYYTYYWKTISVQEFLFLVEWLDKAKVTKLEKTIEKIVLPISPEKRVLELLGIPHTVASNEFVVIEKDPATALFTTLNINFKEDLEKIKSVISQNPAKNVLDILNMISNFEVRDKGGIFIGARMGRPEKAKMRKLIGAPHVLFPVGAEGGKMRSFQSALEVGRIKADFPNYYCTKCNKTTIYRICEVCDRKAKEMFYCRICGIIEKEECQHGKAESYKEMEVDINHYFDSALKKLKTKTYPDLIKGVRGTSNKKHIPENILKGILRAKHDIYVNKDGTIRYDMTQIPITHFKPREIRTPIEKLKELGYTHDINGRPLESDQQILELLPQDVILPACQESLEEGANKIFYRITRFIDELLAGLYDQKPFYNLKSERDLVGHIVLALAPHTSAAIACRILGFSDTQGFFAHPLLHAATRRDADGDECSIILLMDALLNFSRQYLPAHRGSTQDACLVLTTKLIPSEVDDMVFDLDTVWKYPLEFYDACMEYKNPWEVKIEILLERLNQPKQYEGLGFTHDTDNLNFGVRCSTYKTIPSMEEKLQGQMRLAEKIRAVDEADTAALVIDKHFLKDTKGNLRKFSMQQFRCVKCNQKFRRPPLIGKCDVCSGRIIFTITEGSVVKYLGLSIALAEKYSLPAYTKQSLELLQRRIESVFGREKEKQLGLEKWV